MRSARRNSKVARPLMQFQRQPGQLALMAIVEFLNQRWLEFAGMTAEQAQGWGWGASIHPDDATTRAVLAIVPGLWYAGSEVEARMRRFDGVYRWFFSARILCAMNRAISSNGTEQTLTLRIAKGMKRCASNEQTLQMIINTIPALAWSSRP